MAVRQPRPEYLSVRSRRTLDPLVAVREDPLETVAESDKTGGFQLIEEEQRPSCLFVGHLNSLSEIKVASDPKSIKARA